MDTAAPPVVFILGSPRSGTSITYYAMREIFGLPGRGEGHVLPIFQRVLHEHWKYAQDFAKRDGTLAQSLDHTTFRAGIIEYLRGFYAARYPGGGFVDKTPGAEAILGAPLIRATFPGARILLTRRTGIEVVQSYRRKFDAGFADACRSWAACMTALQRTREAKVEILELDQFDYTNAPREVAAEIAAFLGQPDRAAPFATFLAERRTDQISGHDWRQRLTLADVDWSGEERQVFEEMCGPAMRAFGYLG